MKKSLKVFLAAAVAGVALSQTAGAETITQQFQVKLVVKASCTFGTTAMSNIDLGSHSTNANTIEQSTSLKVNCTNGATPIIKMQSGHGDWKLKDAAGAEVGYQIVKADGNVWDAANPITYTSTGADEIIPVKAKVANVGNKAGTFTDMVTVSVDF
jgi:spore coat protein U-like protein